jgi:hypothetical protein
LLIQFIANDENEWKDFKENEGKKFWRLKDLVQKINKIKYLIKLLNFFLKIFEKESKFFVNF